MSDTTSNSSVDDADKLLQGHLYKLSGKKPVPCSLEEYIHFMKSATNRIVEQTQVADLLVSTIFTGIDHSFGTGEKQLFETKVFGLPDETQPRWRFATWNHAVSEHRKLVVMLKTKGKEGLIEEIRKQQE